MYITTCCTRLLRRGCSRCRCSVFLGVIGRRRGCAGGRVGLLHFVMPVVLRSGIGRLSGRLRRGCWIVRGRGGGALRLGNRWILRGRRGAGL